MSSKSSDKKEQVAEEEEVEEEIDDEEEEEYAEAEPVLTYVRMKNDINEILQKDSVSCIKADHKVNKLFLLLVIA
jgi:hypothetical protein